MSTTDLHANLLPYDYYADKGDQPYGLARTATLIRAARAEASNVMLFDNGDALQGTPLSDITAQADSGWTGDHPMITAMNHLGYDAAGLGNHEFNFGLDWLTQTLSAARFPITCANVTIGPGPMGAPLLPPYLLLPRQIIDTQGQSHTLILGVIGLVPTQITIWDTCHLSGQATAQDMVQTARRLIPQMRHQGADLVLMLAHTGIESGPYRPGMENAALSLAAVPGVDALIAGHSHQVFPQTGGITQSGVDPDAGTFSGTPAVMAGFRGSHLGVLDLNLERRAGTWRIQNHHAEARPVAPASDRPAVTPDRSLGAAIDAAHNATLTLVARPAGHSAAPLHTFLAMAECSAAVRVVTQAQRAALRCAMTGTAYETLPILSASAPFKTGGRGGPLHFTDIPAGPLSLRHIADLCGFPNTLCGLHLSGADLRDWLERAAICFRQIRPGGADQPLCDPDVPGHNFDLIDGLSYCIDLSVPPRYSMAGALANPGAHRIRDLLHAGQPVEDEAMFLLATNSYRAAGSGPYRSWPASVYVHQGRTIMRDLVADHLRSTGTTSPTTEPVWRFAPLPGTSVLLDTGPGVRHVPGALEQIQAEDLGQTPLGFARLRLGL
ncbi:bifunctional 2',3'-cyclic-nucleotide 2'-phosphodiesterase/3'-nucleotidase [Pseudohalocynthiibacter aestuariivivens]|nr:bifunctional 2',3'-cyclic-nucleotide 2'-phosphodiesterase/3'-nucleotidase [Pseudohalocynthiibacter aestuariivivens]